MNSDTPGNATEWFEWLSEEEKQTQNSYLAKPKTLIANYRSEISATEEYRGREILELLQNAADGAGSLGVTGQVVIDISEYGLIVANSGAYFTKGGVSSLEQAHLSPKKKGGKQFVGNKGLGFRAVLNWTNSPIILSGSLAISFNKERASQKLKDLMVGSEELNVLVKEEAGNTDEVICPLLAFPIYTENSDISLYLQTTGERQLYQRCVELREQGLDTCIAMPFSEDGLYEEVENQIALLNPEILLFVNHLQEVKFYNEGVLQRVWNVESQDDLKLVNENGEPLGIWQIFKRGGRIPSDIESSSKNQFLDYELVCAVPEYDENDESQSSPLFSYFPTNLDLPLPSVCHATLELDQSRNHIKSSASNQFVLEQLAVFLADVAEERAKSIAVGVNAGFRQVHALGTFPLELKKIRFEERLLAASRERSIIPLLGGDVVNANEATLLEGANASWLPARHFPDLVAYQGYLEEQFFKSLGVAEISTAGSFSTLLCIFSASWI